MKRNLKYKRLGKRIHDERIKRGFSQEDLAGISRLHRTHITRIENGKTNPSYDTLVHIAKKFKIPVWILIAPPKWNWKKYFENTSPSVKFVK